MPKIVGWTEGTLGAMYATQLAPYRPQIYSVGSRTRYRQYPDYTVAPIPGTGFRNRQLVFARQQLLLGLGRLPTRWPRIRGITSRGVVAPTDLRRGVVAPTDLRRRGGRYSAGLGATTRETVQTIADVIANPERALQTRSAAIVAALDRHVVQPTVERVGSAMVPYVVKYVLPPFALLLTLTAVGAYYAHKAAKK